MVRQAAVFAGMLIMSAPPLYGQEALFTVTTPSADVHKAPSTGSAVIGKAPRGETFRVTRELGSWVRIPWAAGDDGAGYLHVTWGTIARAGAAESGLAAGTLVRTPAPGPSQLSPPSPSRPPVPPPATVLLPSHLLGVGGRTGSQALRFAGTGRAWIRGPVGVQIEVGRSTHASVASPDRLRTLQFAPSAIYSLPNVVTDAIWARPYLGGGAGVYRSTLRSQTPDATSVTDTGLGYQLFGGAELTWANVPQLAVSADLRQQWAPTPFIGYDAGGLGFSMSLHWYVK